MGCQTRKKTIMADITMCAGTNCEIKDKCYRYLAPKSKLWQSYFAETPIKENGNCAMFWDTDT